MNVLNTFELKTIKYCSFRVSEILTGLKGDGVDPQQLLDNLEYVQIALDYLVLELE